MDDTPTAFFTELKNGILKKRVGQIAVAVVLAEEVLRFLATIVWSLIIPVIGKLLQGNTESVLFEGPARNPIPWINLAGAVIELVFVIIVVFYANRWIHGKPIAPRRTPAQQLVE